MIRGLGIDLCEIKRMEDALTHPRFLLRFYSEEEQAYILSKKTMAAQTAAGLFAAKEAFLKALGTGITSLSLCEVQVAHDEKGAPYYLLCGKQKEQMAERQAETAHLSITHDGGMAAAVCILEG